MKIEDLQARSLVDEELDTKAKEEAEAITTSTGKISSCAT